MIVRDFPLLYEEDPKVYLDRQNRIRRALEEIDQPKGIVVAEWAKRFRAIQDEVAELPLVLGVRYRVRLLGGKIVPKHRHFRGDQGEEYVVDLPGVEDVEWQEIEGVFRGRQRFDVAASSIILDLAGQAAMFADADVLRCEEIR